MSSNTTIIFVFPFFQTKFYYKEHYLSLELNKLGYKTIFITSTLQHPIISNFTEQFKSEEIFEIIKLKSIKIFTKSIPIDFKPISRLSKFDNYIVNFSGISNPFNILILNKFIKDNFNAKYYYHDHSNIYNVRLGITGGLYYNVIKFLFNKNINKIRYIFTPNEDSLDLLMKVYNIHRSKFKIVPLGYNKDIFNYKDYNLSEKDKYFNIGFAGKVNKLKNIPLLFRAISKSQFKDKVFLSIVGINDAYTLNKFKALANDLKLNNYQITPIIKDKYELANFYRKLNLAVFPGSISIGTIEASGCGTPVAIYASLKDLDDRISNDRGFIFSNEQELTEIINNCINNSISFNRFEISKKTEIYSWENITSIYLKYFYE